MIRPLHGDSGVWDAHGPLLLFTITKCPSADAGTGGHHSAAQGDGAQHRLQGTNLADADMTLSEGQAQRARGDP